MTFNQLKRRHAFLVLAPLITLLTVLAWSNKLPSPSRIIGKGSKSQGQGSFPNSAPRGVLGIEPMHQADHESPSTPTTGLSGTDQLCLLVSNSDSQNYVAVAAFQRALKRLSGKPRLNYLIEAGQLLAPDHGDLLHDLLPKIENSRERQAVIKAATSTLLERDPETAARWISQLKADSSRANAYEVLGREWARTSLDDALSWTNTSSLPPQDQARTLEGILWTWMQDDPVSGREYVETIQDTVLHAQLVRKAVKVLATQDPQAAASWAVNSASSNNQRELIDYSVTRWAQQDYEAARIWVEEIDDDNAQHGAANALVRVWSHTDPAAATKWITENQSESEHHRVLLSSSRLWAEQYPIATAEWLTQMDDQITQQLIMDNITRTMAAGDRSAAAAWVDLTTTNPDLHARGLTLLKQTPPTP